MTELSDRLPYSLIPTLNRLIFPEPDSDESLPKSKDLFPLRLRIDPNGSATESLQDLKNFFTKHNCLWSTSNQFLLISFLERGSCDEVVAHLLEKNWDVTYDYSDFATHPGTLFVRHLLRSLTLLELLGKFFNLNSKYASVVDINIIPLGPENAANDVLAILKFDNYLDVEHLVNHLPLDPNPFNPGTLLYINRYMSKKERYMLLTGSTMHAPLISPDDSVVYDTVVIENFSEFLAGQVNLETVAHILLKFELFNPIDTVHFPVANEDPELLRFKKAGFVSFVHNRDMNVNTLKCLYYLNDLTYQQVKDFSHTHIYDISHDVNKPDIPPGPSETPRLKISIAQRKHNHHLYSESFFVHNQPELLSLRICDPAAITNFYNGALINKFLKSSNYQETNVYVNYFSIVFENNDKLWATFWNQFGVDGVKSAKIIKPQFYSKKSDDSLGKIGFVFYEGFKMALRAIILTNNKTIRFNGHPDITIQTSFAIQKHSLGSGKPPPKFQQQNSLPNYHYFPNRQDAHFSKRFSVPMPSDASYFIPEQAENPPFMAPQDPFMLYPYFYPMQQQYPPPGVQEQEKKIEFLSTTSASPKQSNETISPLTAPFSPPMGYYYNPYYPYSQLPPQVPVNALVPFQFENFSMQRASSERHKKERPKKPSYS